MKRLISSFAFAFLLTLGIQGIALSPAALAEPAKQVQTTVQSTSGDLIIPEGVTASYDASRGPLQVHGRLENHGTLQITGAGTQAKIETNELLNSGVIVSQVPNLTIDNNAAGAFALDLKSGQITSPASISFISKTDIKLAGGNIAAERISFTSDQKVRVHANRIDGKVAISSGSGSAIGVNEGNLIVERNDTTADPLYYNFSGDLSAPGFTGSGFVQDYVAVASGAVTVTGDVSTTGSVSIWAGVNFHLNGTLPTSGTGAVSDSDCLTGALTTCGPATVFDSYTGTAKSATTQNITSTGNGIGIRATGTITVNGNLTANDATNGSIFSESLGTQTFNGTLTCARNAYLHTLADGSIIGTGNITAGGEDIFAGNSTPVSTTAVVSISGDVTALGVVRIFAGADIAVNNVTAGTSTVPGKISIETELGGASSQFVIGAATGTNYALSIAATTDTGGGADFYTGSGTPLWTQYVGNQYVYVSNSGNGGISITDGSKITITATSSAPGAILIDASGGTLALNGGTLSASSSGANPAGQIVLRAHEVDLNNGSSVTADDNSGASNDHYVLIAARVFSYTGGTTSLSAGGASGADVTTGLIFNTDTGTAITGGITPPVVTQVDMNNVSLQITSSDSSTLNAYTFGDNTGSYIAANPVSFNLGATGLASFFAYGNDTTQTIHYPGTASGVTSLTFANGTIAFAADGTADGGTITIDADGISSSSTAAVLLNADALTGTGDGGTITILGQGIDLSASYNAFSASALVSGAGGQITVTGGTITGSYMKLPGTLTANGYGGIGGIIDLTLNNASPMTLDGATISASGDPIGQGAGGFITITNVGPITMASTSLLANSAGDYAAGDIMVTSTTDPTTPIDLSTATISATVDAASINDGNNGGTVSFNNVINGAVGTAINVLSTINVNGGPETTGPYDGTISLNGVTCQQWLSDNALDSDYDWLTTFWDCAGVTTETTNDSYPQADTNLALSSTLRTITGTSRINLFVFSNQADLNNFFQLSRSGDYVGVTFQAGPGPETTLYSSVTETYDGGSGGSTALQAQEGEVTIHELGHAFDDLLGPSTQSGSTAYNNGVQNDFFYLDYLLGTGPTYTPRDACVASGSTPAPFANNSLICPSGALAGASGPFPNTFYVSMGVPQKNSYILQTLSGTDRGSIWITHSGLWSELYAQSLAYYAFTSQSGLGLGLGFHDVLSMPLFTQGYFSCAVGWATQIQMGTTSPSVTSTTEGTCGTNNVPAGYGPWN